MFRAATTVTSSRRTRVFRRAVSVTVGTLLALTYSLPSVAGASRPSAGNDQSNQTISSNSSSLSDVTLDGTLPAWASSGSTLSVFGWSNTGVPLVGNVSTLSELATATVSGNSFSEVISPNGYQNVLILLTDGTQESTVFSSLVSNQSTATSVAMASEARELGGAITHSASSILVAPFTTVRSTSAASELISMSRSRVPRLTINGCAATTLSNSAPTWTPIGQVHTVNQTSAFFTYGQSTSSSFSVGISLNNTYGSFSTSGSVTTDGGSNSGFNVNAGVHQFVNSQFIYTNYKLICYIGRQEVTEYAVASSNWSGGLQLGASAPSNPRGACNHLTDEQVLPNQYQGVSFGSSDTMNAGINLLGFDFSETVTYTSQTNIDWHNTGSTTTYLCGSNENIGPGGQNIVYNSATQY